MGSQRDAPVDFLLRKSAGDICVEDWLGLKDDLDGYGKRENLLPPPNFELRTLQQATSHSTDNGFLAPANMFVETW